ncbi:MAG TPA: GspH/FimT family pseudopilin [Thermoanaerobaculia bacterium]|nr:GspH/FimT family pseudopilin [Thermoanaerobaculia bacterium]
MHEIRAHSQRGYSLIEMLVVVAIIGMLSLVAVPNFINLYQSTRLKSSLRQFTSDLRGARQQAVTQYVWVKVDVKPTGMPGRYSISVSNDLGTTWGTPLFRDLLEPIYVNAITFEDGTDADDWPEIVFRNNGTVANVPAGEVAGEVELKTDANIAKRVITVRVNPSGKISAE